MPIKQEVFEDAYDADLQDPCDMVRAILPEPQSPAMKAEHPMTTAFTVMAIAIGRLSRRRSNFLRNGRWETIPMKGTDEAPNSYSIRLALREYGIA